jgi:hypothetical protein
MSAASIVAARSIAGRRRLALGKLARPTTATAI